MKRRETLVAKMYRAADAARAAELNRRQVEVLIARGLVIPQHEPENGQTRLYSEDEIVRLAILGEVTRLSVDATKCAESIAKMHFLNVPFALVLYHGFVELIRTSTRGSSPHEPGGPDAVYARPEFPEPVLAYEVLPMAKVADFIARREVAAAVIVPIDRIEQRVKDRLAKARFVEVADEAAPPAPVQSPPVTKIDAEAIYARMNARKPGEG